MLDADPCALPRHGEHQPYAACRNAATFPASVRRRDVWSVFALFALHPGAAAATNASCPVPGKPTFGTVRATTSNRAHVARAPAETCPGSSSAVDSIPARIEHVQTSTPGATLALGYNSDLGYTSTTDVTLTCGQRPAAAEPSTAVALLSGVRLLSAEEMMPRHMRGFWSRALRLAPLHRAPFVRCAPPTLPCVCYYCTVFAAAASHVLAAPNGKAMRSRLRLAMVLLCVGLPAAAALHNPAHEKAGDDETPFDAAPPPPRAPDARRSERGWMARRADGAAGNDGAAEATSRVAATIVQPGHGTLQRALEALAAAAAAGEFVLADGTYTGTSGEAEGTDNVLIIQMDVTIRAQNAGRAILDGEQTRRVVYIDGTASVVLDGLVITGGYAYVRDRLPSQALPPTWNRP